MIRLKPQLVTAPAVRIISLDEAKRHCRVIGTNEDALIEALILAAESYLDGHTGVLGRALINQTWRESCSNFPSQWRDSWSVDPDNVLLPLALQPIASITSVKYYAEGETTLTTVDPDTYRLIAKPSGVYLELVEDESWPEPVANRSDAVQV
ncbi:MAG: head-tail connector protein, partial [Alsobacter sp.]